MSATDNPRRIVVAADGRSWQVFIVPEGMRWDPEIEMRRASWLCCQTDEETRYINPVPPDWQRWSDEQLLAAIIVAPLDHRRGR
ncbi:MAG: hypothetical protein ABIV10_09370 [Gemmatimonadaceae bacterium]